MPHPREPNQIDVKAQQLASTSNANGVGTDSAPEGYTDPAGRFTTVFTRAEMSDSGDDSVTFEIENNGVPVKLRSIMVGCSQGAENGRAYWKIGYDTSGDPPTGIRADEAFLWQMATAAGGSRFRESQHWNIPEELQPTLDSKEDFILMGEGDSDTTDSFKTWAQLWFVPQDDEAGHDRL